MDATLPIGHERERSAPGALVRSADVQLITLTGPSRVARRRLAIEPLNEQVLEVQQGLLVALSEGADPQRVATAIAAALGVRCRSGCAPLRQLERAIRDQRVFLVLDNPQDIDRVGRAISSMLRSCPGLVIVATSRPPLHAPLEHLLRVEPRAAPEVAPGACPTAAIVIPQDATESAQHTSPPASTPLTKRELEVLALVAEGLSDAAIAHRLTMTPRTARYHVASLSQKLAAKNRTHAVVIALRRQLLAL